MTSHVMRTQTTAMKSRKLSWSSTFHQLERYLLTSVDCVCVSHRMASVAFIQPCTLPYFVGCRSHQTHVWLIPPRRNVAMDCPVASTGTHQGSPPLQSESPPSSTVRFGVLARSEPMPLVR